ncbi:MAG: hypothetical protein ACJ763_10085 [Bdellovibrionia bacterium]
MISAIKKIKSHLSVLPAVAAATFALFAVSTPAQAGTELNVIGGVSFLGGAAHNGLSTLSPLVGGSLLFGVAPLISIGPVYEYNFVYNHGSTGHRSYYGALARVNVGNVIFVDGTLGATAINYGVGSTSDLAFSGGADVGIHMLPFIYPFVGYRYTPTKGGASSTDGNTIDVGVMFSIGN